MSEHRATIEWNLRGEFEYKSYPRVHDVNFGGGVRIPGNAAPENVPPTVPPAPGADPEQQFVASLSSCHMLWFLHLACNRKFVVARYHDEAVGILGKDGEGKDAMTRVTLRPVVSFSGKAPSEEEHAKIHEKAHQRCFIANSVKTEVVVEPRIA